MALNQELRDLIRSIVKNEFEEVYGVACTVSNVREDGTLGWVCDCSPINGNSDIKDVRLKAEKGGGLLITPSDGSVVFVVMEDEFNAFVSMYGNIDSVQFFDGENGGLINIEDLVEKLNVLEERMGTHQHLSPVSGAPTLPDPATNPIIIQTEVGDLEDAKIIH